MVWIGISIGLLTVTGLLALMTRLDRRASKDLGHVSSHWLAAHRINSSER
jgi:hypothetical protein